MAERLLHARSSLVTVGSRSVDGEGNKIGGSGTSSSSLSPYADGDLQKQPKMQQAVDFNFSFFFLDLFTIFFLPLNFLFFPSSGGKSGGGGSRYTRTNLLCFGCC